jgi:hypothetical protein
VIATWAVSLGLLGGAVAVADAPEAHMPVAEHVIEATPEFGLPSSVQTTATSTPETLPPESTTTPTPPPSVPPETVAPETQPLHIQPAQRFAVPLLSPDAMGVDISWPPDNCDAILPEGTQFAILGLSGGQTGTLNECAPAQYQKLRDAGVTHIENYFNTDYVGLEILDDEANKWLYDVCNQDDAGFETCVAYNYGKTYGKTVLKYAVDNGFYSPMQWADVEFWSCNNPPCWTNGWSENQAANWQRIKGQMDGMTEAAIELGVDMPTFGAYAVWTGNQFRKITGTDGEQSGLRLWIATGDSGSEYARSLCTVPSFTGGPVVYAQHVDRAANNGRGLDMDIAC